MMEIINLNGRDWYAAWYPGDEGILRNDHKNERLLGFIPAQVPGVVQEDLIEHGIIDDPYYDMNSMKCEWVPQRGWIYKKFLTFDDSMKGKRLRLHFEGVDYSAKFYINGVFLGEHTGMFTPAEFDITNYVKFEDKNIISVAIEEAPREECQVGHTSKVKTTKARVNYWWDFAVRIIPLGIWDDVYIIADEGCSIDNLRNVPELSADFKEGRVLTEMKLSSERSMEILVHLDICFDGAVVSSKDTRIWLKKGENNLNINSVVENPKLWWPNGYGESALYDVKAVLLEGEKEIYRHQEQLGFKKVIRLPNEGFDNAPDYRFNVNGRDIFIKGWNWVPVDLLYGRDKTKKYRHLIELAQKAHVNLFRVWGGGLIEKEIFYRLCDEKGIMVWQEFNQSSSGLDNIPDGGEEYIKMLHDYARTVVMKRRNHVSLTMWCGGNELQDRNGIPLDETNHVLKMLGDVVREYGNNQIYLPTSSYGKVFGLGPESVARKGELYDVHGPWCYQGLKEQCSLYNEDSCAFHSEFGVEGAVDYKTLEKFMPKDKMWPPTRGNRSWSHHGAWWINIDMMNRVFGEINDIKEYCKLSQYIQAEGLRYAVEAERRRALQCGGTIPWQFNEPYPNDVCTSSIDYYGKPKMAYYYVKNAYAPVNVSLKYNSQLFEKKVEFEVWINSSIKLDAREQVSVKAYNLQGNELFHKKYIASGLELERGVMVSRESFETDDEVVLVRVKSCSMKSPNEYLFIKGSNLSALRHLKNAELVYEKHEEMAMIKNAGSYAALFIALNVPYDENYFSLLPGEERCINIDKDANTSIDWFNKGSDR